MGERGRVRGRSFARFVGGEPPWGIRKERMR